MTTRSQRAVAVLCALAVLIVTSPALGEGRYICGLTQRLHYNLPQWHNGCNLNLAREWSRCFRHVSTAQAGALVVSSRKGKALGGGPGGHVSRIVRLTKPCHAIVADEKGQYQRNICKRLIAYVVID